MKISAYGWAVLYHFYYRECVEHLRKNGKRLLIHAGTGPVGNEFTGINHFKKLLEQYPDMRIIVPRMSPSLCLSG